VDASDGKPPSVKLILDAKGDAIDNPTVQVQPTFKNGTAEQFFKWYKSPSSLMEVQSVGEHYRLALQALRGTGKALWQHGLDLASPKVTSAAGISNDATEKLWYDFMMKLTTRVLKDPRAGFKQVHYIEPYLWIGKNTGIQHIWIILTSFLLTCLSFRL
jgi:hypothetical protein